MSHLIPKPITVGTKVIFMIKGNSTYQQSIPRNMWLEGKVDFINPHDGDMSIEFEQNMGVATLLKYVHTKCLLQGKVIVVRKVS